MNTLTIFTAISALIGFVLIVTGAIWTVFTLTTEKKERTKNEKNFDKESIKKAKK